MKRLTLLAASLALACATTVYGQAKDGGPQIMGGPEFIMRGGGAGGGGFGGANEASFYIQNLDAVVNFTEEQKTTITGIFDARKKAMQDFSTQNADKLKAASKAMTDAYKTEDQAAIAKAAEGYQAVYAPMQKIMKTSSDDLNKVLTKEQNAKVQDSRAMAYIKMTTSPAKLSDDQVKQLKAAYRDAMKDGQDRREGGGILSQAVDQVLTPDQKATIAKGRATSYVKQAFGGAKLTADQLKKVDIICEDLAKESDPQSRQMYSDLNEKVNALLTDDQKAAMKQGQQWGMPGAPKALGTELKPGANPAPNPARNP